MEQSVKDVVNNVFHKVHIKVKEFDDSLKWADPFLELKKMLGVEFEYTLSEKWLHINNRFTVNKKIIHGHIVCYELTTQLPEFGGVPYLTKPGEDPILSLEVALEKFGTAIAVPQQRTGK